MEWEDTEKGEVASALTVTHLGKRFQESASVGTKIDAVNWLSDNINEINKEIFKYGEENENSKGLGTTVVAAIVTKEFLIFANIGDSSGYVMKNKKLHKVTKPHTLVNFLVDTGDITLEEAKNHPKKNVLMKALGVTENANLIYLMLIMEVVKYSYVVMDLRECLVMNK